MFTIRQQQGFTLIELMMTLVIATIMATVAIPGFNNLIQDNRIVNQSNNLVASLALARSEAIKRGQPVSVCASSNHSSCNSSSYEKGWLVFSDTGSANILDGTDQILRSQEKSQGSVDIITSGNNKVRYMPTGLLATASDDSSLVANATTEFVPSWADRMVFALLPGNMAIASSGSSGGSSGSGSSGSGSSGSGSSGSGSSGSGSSGGSNSGSSGACNGGGSSNGGSGGSGSGSSGSGSSGSGSSGSGSSGSGSSGSGSSGGSNNSGNNSGSGCDDEGNSNSGAAGSSTFKVCDDRRGETGRQVTVSATGRISSRKVSCD